MDEDFRTRVQFPPPPPDSRPVDSSNRLKPWVIRGFLFVGLYPSRDYFFNLVNNCLCGKLYLYLKQIMQIKTFLNAKTDDYAIKL